MLRWSPTYQRRIRGMTADDTRRLDELGYVVLPALRTISKDILSSLEILFESAGENAGHALRTEPFARVVDIPLGDAGAFAVLLNDALVLEFVRHRLGAGFGLTSIRACSLNPFAIALEPPRPGLGASSSRAACLVLWLLDDFTAEGAAAIRVVPGSHLAALGASFNESAAVAVSAAAGSVILLDGRLWTASGPNPTNRHLRMLICNYEQK